MFVPLYYFWVLPQVNHLPDFLGYTAMWLVLAYLFFMIVHSCAGGVSTINSRVPVGATILVFTCVAALLSLGAYLEISAT